MMKQFLFIDESLTEKLLKNKELMGLVRKMQATDISLALKKNLGLTTKDANHTAGILSQHINTTTPIQVDHKSRPQNDKNEDVSMVPIGLQVFSVVKATEEPDEWPYDDETTSVMNNPFSLTAKMTS